MECQKHLFQLHEHVHYLNCAYMSPLLRSSEEASMQAIVKSRNPSDLTIDDFFVEVEEVKKKFGVIVKCSPSNVAVMPSTSYGFASVLNNIKGESRHNVVTVKDEFPSGYFGLQSWCASNNAEMRIASPDESLLQLGESWNQKILNCIDVNTKIVLISSVHWMSGLKFDLKRIGQKCRSVNAFFIVDGTQSVGALPINVKDYNIDALICASYKWLFGPYSICLAYLNDKFNNGKPLEESWMNRTNAQQFSQLTDYEDDYTEMSGRYNMGESSNFILMPILNESLSQIIKWKVDEIQAYCSNLIKPLLEFLNEIGGIVEKEEYFSNHLFSLRLPSNINATVLKKNLDKHHIVISIRGTSLRISINVFNDERDIFKLIEVIKLTQMESN